MTDHSELGPGLVAGASDVDPTTVATMSVVGSTTGFALSWLTLLTLPMLAVIQAISSRVAVAGGADLQTLVRRRYPRGAQLLLLGSVLVVTAMTTAADLEAGAAALGLLLHIGRQWLVVPVAAAVLTVLLLGSYDEVQRVLKYLMLGLLAYVVTAVIAHPHWGQVAHGSLVPRISLRHDYVEGALAILGTTLTSYVYVWQTVELSEERPALSWLRPEEADAIAGIVVAVVIFWAILVATGATLAGHHAHVQTAEDAARRSSPWWATARSTCSAQACSARRCWPCRCSWGRLPTSWGRSSTGGAGSHRR
jgi:Mn2+/Fe2+ NRAMP family transporter